MHVGGGPEQFLEDHAVIVTSDHSQAGVEARIRLDEPFADFHVASPSAARSVGAEIALSPAQRSAQIYALDEERRAELVQQSLAAIAGLEGVDLAMYRSDGEAVVRGSRGELHFVPGGELTDARGGWWSVEGDLATLGAHVEDGRIETPDYPDALCRIWSALSCETSGDILLSAAPGYEFVDWGGADHVGGGSHGSLHRSDSLGALLWCGTGPDSAQSQEQWSLRDVTPMVCQHFGVGKPTRG
jgi:hypothetical protein